MHLSNFRAPCGHRFTSQRGIHPILSLLSVLALLTVACAQQAPSEPWWSAVENFEFPEIAAKRLTDKDFASVLGSSHSAYAIIDFYAAWCPHCQHFAVDYERLAIAARRSNNVAPGESKVFVGSVDCFNSEALCKSFNISSYPIMLWGRPQEFVNKAGKLTQFAPTFETVDVEPRTAGTVSKWINDRLHLHIDTSQVSRSAIVKAQHARDSKQGQLSAARKADFWDVQLALALMIRNALQTHSFSGEPGKVLLDFIKLAAAVFPDEHDGKCRESLSALHQQLRTNPPQRKGRAVLGASPGQKPTELMMVDVDELEKRWQLCGVPWDQYRRGWRACRGTWPGKRGLTCGYWQLMHSFAARMQDGTALGSLETLRSFLWYFFDCEDCAKHFFMIPIQKEDARTRRSTQLWLWRAHNIVNDRVKGLEKNFADGDPAFPKQQWPSPDLCPSCRVSSLQQQRSETLGMQPVRRQAEHDSRGRGVLLQVGTEMRALGRQSSVGEALLLQDTKCDAESWHEFAALQIPSTSGILSDITSILKRRGDRLRHPPKPAPPKIGEPVNLPGIKRPKEVLPPDAWDLEAVLTFLEQFYASR